MRAVRPGALALVMVTTAAALLLCGCSGGASDAGATASSASPVTSTSPSGTATGAASSASPGATEASPSGSASTSPSASASASTSPSPSATPTHDPALVGTWHADAAAILADNLGRGGLRSLTECTGPVVLTLGATNVLDDSGRITCTGRSGISAHGQFSSRGRYTADGTVLRVSGAVTRCTLSVVGASIPCSFAYSNGTASYRVSGDTLTLSFRTPTGTRTQTYHR